MSAPLLKVDNLAVEFGTEANPIRAVDGVSFEIEAGGAVGIVGESGSGKSITVAVDPAADPRAAGPDRAGADRAQRRQPARPAALEPCRRSAAATSR